MFLPEVSIRRPVMATMIIVAMVVMGMLAYPRVGVDLEPDVEFPFVAVSTVLVGASPDTMELKVTKPIEDSLSTIPGLKRIMSTSQESFSQVFCEFQLSVAVDVAAQDVRDKVAQIENDLPSGTEKPIVTKIDPKAEPILFLVMSGPDAIQDITKLATDKVKPGFQKIPGVGDLTFFGARDRQVRIWLDPERLMQYGVTPADVVQMLQMQNIEFPGGRIETPNLEYIVKTKGELSTVEAFNDLIITYRENSPVRLRDLGRVEDGISELRSYSNLNGQTALGFSLRKQSDANALEVTKRVRAEVARFNNESLHLLPKGYKIQIARDRSTFVEESFNDVMHHIIYGGLLALLVVLLFLRNLRSTFIVALALPSSIIGTFYFLDLIGFTFNMMTLLGLSISVGMLVDDAIVVIENIYRHREMGKSAMQAAMDGTNEIAFAVIVTTLAIVAVFVPVAFMEGIVGQYFYEFGITVTVAVMLSLVVSLVLTPMMGSRILSDQKENALARWIERMLVGMERFYGGIVRWALSSRLTKAMVVVVAVLAFFSAIFLTSKLNTEFIPYMDRGEMLLSVKAPLGSRIEAPMGYLKQIEEYAHKMPEVVLTQMQIGNAQGSSVHEGSIFVKLVDKELRKRSQHEVEADFRKFMKGLGVEFNVGAAEGMAGGGTGMRGGDVEYQIRGEEIEEIYGYALELKKRLESTPGFLDVRVSYDPAKPELRVLIDRERAAAYNVPVAAIGEAIRIGIGGVEASQFREKGDQYEVWVRFTEERRDSPFDIYNVPIRSASGEVIRLHNLVRVEESTGPVLIERESRRKQVTVYANLNAKVIKLGRAKQEILRHKDEMRLPPTVQGAFSGMADIQDESNVHIYTALILAIIVVYMLLASQFNSFIHPITIMLSVLMSFVGAIFGLIAAGQTLNLISQIGIIMLMGLVTKNAILLVEFANQLRERGLERDEALAEAGSVRLRPILMTSLATIMGSLPIALGIGAGAEMRQPMAVAVIGGLTTSTLLTLVVVPVVYSIFDSLKKLVGFLLIIVGALVLTGLAWMSFF